MVNSMGISGRGAKQKGSGFERDIRNELKRIYPPERRKAVGRIPMSGAGNIKGDVLDQNNTEFCYECKKHERLSIPEWWKQTLSQTQSWQTPVLAFSSNYRPIYWVLRERDWLAYIKQAELEPIYGIGAEGTLRGLYKKLKGLQRGEYYRSFIKDEPIAIIQNEDFITLRKVLWNQ